MPKGIRKEYTKEFKLSVVMLMKSKTMRPKEIFELYGGLDRQTAYRWIKEYAEKGADAFDPKRAVLPGSELRRLQRENAKLREHVEILKKATAYFAKTNTKE